MPGMYTVSFTQQTLTNAGGDFDLFEVTPADDIPLEIVGLVLAVTSEVGDAAEEILPIQIIRGHATTGNGTSATPRPIDPKNAAASFTAETMGSTIASAGTGVTVYADALNVRAGLQVWFPDGCGPRVTQADTTIVVRSSGTAADDATMSGTLFVREL
jgi:hypothetical protein